MTNNVNNVLVGKPKVSGGALIAPLGTALPTTLVATLNAAFKSAGYLGDAGLTRGEKRDTAVKNAWGGDVIAVTQKGVMVTAKLLLAEYLNPVVQTAIYGAANITVTAATSGHGNQLTIIGNSAPCPRNAWDFEIISGASAIRLVFPDAQITDTGDVVYKDDDIAAREVTLTLRPDASGNYFYEYTDDGQLTP